MHEVGIMQEAVNLAEDSARAHGGGRIRALTLRVGALSGAVPEALEFAFEAVAVGTLAEGATLSIQAVPARWWCATCAEEFANDDPLAACPRCQTWSGELRGGRELELSTLELS
jgi:hydrogenase nickel incorporation protein HypA/HybF